MRADGDPKPSNESSSTLQGLLSKCGIVVPSFSVRGKKTSGGEENRSNMSPANSPQKKRKRTSNSPLSLTERPVKMVGSASKAAQPSTTNEPSKHGVDAFGKHLNAVNSKSAQNAHRQYTKARDELTNNEATQAWDYAATLSSSPAERRATMIIRALREYERKVIFGNNASEAVPGPDTLDMGGQFLTNKLRIETRSKVFQIAKEVPKGALLHLHFNAELNPERLLIEANSMDNMYVWSKRALTSEENLRETEMVFDVLPKFVPSNNIFSPNYKGTDNTGIESWKAEKKHAQENNCRDTNCEICKNGYKAYMKWSDFKKQFQAKFGKQFKQPDNEKNAAGNRLESEPKFVDLVPAENWIKQKMVLSEFEAYDPSQTVNGVWARFNQATRCFKGLMNYKKVYEWYIGAAIERLIDEKIMYAELRPMLMDKTIPDTDGTKMLDLSQQMRLITECVSAKLEEKDNNGIKKRESFPFGLKIIYCTPRSIPKPKMQSEMRDCIRLKREFPDLICGFDLVGAEDRPNHIGFYREELVAFKEACKEEGLDVPFMFHAGETLLDTGGSSDPKNSNLFDAVALHSKRVGHGFSLLKHPQLVEKFKQEKDAKGRVIPGTGICIELCPISNELLHLCRNIKEHPYPELLAAGIPCCVNSDNPSLFGNSMSHEFYQIMVGSPTMSLHSWKQLAQWSLEYSCLDEGGPKSDKDKAQKLLLESYDRFCALVDKKYGHLVDSQGYLVEDQVETAYSHPPPLDSSLEEGRHYAFFVEQKRVQSQLS